MTVLEKAIEKHNLEREQYYTDGRGLYRIIDINNDWTVLVENCSTEYTHIISIDTVFDEWELVKMEEENAVCS